MLNIIINNFNRLIEQKLYLIVAMALTICSVIAAILMTNSIEMKSNIAMVGIENMQMDIPKCNITYLETKPSKSVLVENLYDAVITKDVRGNYKVETTKNNDFKKGLENALNNPTSISATKDDSRKIGTNILGFMLMFLLMQGVLYGRLFAEDKEKHLTERVVISPISFTKYLMGHGTFIWLLIFIPSMFVIICAKTLGVEVGFSLIKYSILIGIIALLSTGFALLINSFFNNAETANMVGSAIIVLTSVLGGSFYSFSKGDTLFDKMLYILPQKDFINYIDILEKGQISNNVTLQILYVIIISVVFISIGIIKTRKDYIYKTR